MRWRPPPGARDPFLTAGWALAGAAGALVLPPGAARLVLLTPLVLFLPGHAVRRALHMLMDGPTREQVTFDVGLSLVAAILTGLMLDQTGPGLQTQTWAAALLCVTVAAAVVDLARHRQRTDGAQPHPRSLLAQLTAMRPSSVLVCGVAAALVVGSLRFSVLDAQRVQAATTFTQLSVAAEDGRAQLGIRNHEGSAVRYGLTVTSDGRVVADLGAFVVPSGGEQRVSYDLPRTSSAQRYVFQLRRPGSPDPYRQVSVVTDGRQPAT